MAGIGGIEGSPAMPGFFHGRMRGAALTT